MPSDKDKGMKLAPKKQKYLDPSMRPNPEEEDSDESRGVHNFSDFIGRSDEEDQEISLKLSPAAKKSSSPSNNIFAFNPSPFKK